MARGILVKPLITEKAQNTSESLNQYSFVVDKKANKLEIKSAVEKMFNVSVVDVNTSNMPSKMKSRSTRKGVVRGRVSGYKKAVVTLPKGEVIDLYGGGEE